MMVPLIIALGVDHSRLTPFVLRPQVVLVAAMGCLVQAENRSHCGPKDLRTSYGGHDTMNQWSRSLQPEIMEWKLSNFKRKRNSLPLFALTAAHGKRLGIAALRRAGAPTGLNKHSAGFDLGAFYNRWRMGCVVRGGWCLGAPQNCRVSGHGRCNSRLVLPWQRVGSSLQGLAVAFD
ncbi:hypothetical protein J1N35_027372 [Gossypium stocksii]|uniref:Uncharacterized protein n=1 Tax=Gossypium stocksii TaxID=47602 RepID=A0A9D3V9L5_9ROSI|nr:hypothetical protein J1N35_027372 [Gossypium stocksii]